MICASESKTPDFATHSSSDVFRDEPGGTMGTEDLCAWKVAAGIYWVQTRRPDYARKLSRRSGSRLVLYSVCGGYLRTYAIPASRRQFVHNLLKRYLKVTNEPFQRLIASPQRPKLAAVSPQRTAFEKIPTELLAPERVTRHETQEVWK